jgi:hypothetical protein
VISHYQRFHPCFYIKAEGEVDLAYVNQGKFFPIEVKWTNQMRPKDLKQIEKYSNALILSKLKQPSMINNIPTEPLPLHLYNSYIRQKLEQVTESKMMSYQQIQQQIQIIKGVLKTDPIPLPEEWRPYPINCHAYALGLGNSEAYREIAYKDFLEKTNRFFASSEFVRYLFEKKVLQEVFSPSVNCLVFYFDENDRVKHAGLLKQVDPELIVESKWGTFDVIFSHKIWHVPYSYGTKIRYYKPVDVKMIETHFEVYIR